MLWLDGARCLYGAFSLRGTEMQSGTSGGEGARDNVVGLIELPARKWGRSNLPNTSI